jgi:predicted dehydrogenase
MLRAAVIGCGVIGAGDGAAAHPDIGVTTHAEAYAACPDTGLVAVCDVDHARARRCGARWGARAYADIEALLAAERPEVISVATPDASHASVLTACVGAGGVRAVLAEKPLALDAGDAAALADLARARGVVLAVNYTRRFTPAYQGLLGELATGALGELQYVSGLYVNGLKHNGTHWLDLLRMLAGDPVSVRGWDRVGQGGSDPTLDAELTLRGGAGARLAALDDHSFGAFEMDLVLTRGRVRVLESGHVIERWDVGDDPRHPGYRAPRLANTTGEALRDGTLHAVADVVRCVRTGSRPLCGGQDGVAALALAEAIGASAAGDGRPITVAPGLPCTP